MKSIKKSKLNFIYLFLTVWLLSCSKKEQPSPNQIKIATLEETVYSTLPSVLPRTVKYTFEYDQQDRISRINDRKFQYGEGNKVSSSRIHRVTQIGSGVTAEYIESLIYEWDLKGRILNIIADSLYYHTYSKSNGTVTTMTESLLRRSLVADYQYNGSGKSPAVTNYWADYDAWGKGKRLETIHLIYNGNNISRTRQELRTLFHPGPGYEETYKKDIYQHYRYDMNPHPLYGAYLQLGFHPYNYGLVVPEHHPASIFSEIQHQDDSPSVNPDWNNAEKFVSVYNSSGYATSIQSTPNIGGSSWRTLVITYY